MSDEYPYGVDICRASQWCAEQVATIPRGSGQCIRREFNGTPLVAHPGESAHVIFLRWHYERILYQIKTGSLSIHDVQLERMPDA